MDFLNPFTIAAIVLLIGAAFCAWMMMRINKVVKKGRRYDGHAHAKVEKVCPRQAVPGGIAKAAGINELTGLAAPGNEFVILNFDPEPRVHIQTASGIGMPTGFFKDCETVEIQFDLNNPNKVYVCDERPVLQKAALFKALAIALGVLGALGLLLFI